MKPKLLTLCALFILSAQIIASAQKTEISVQKGEVIAETANQSVAIGAGRKAILTANEMAKVTVDSPLVEDTLEIYKLIEKEKQNSDLRIDSTFILVGRADKDEAHAALYFEFPNYGSEATKVMTLGHASIMENFRVYDLTGNLCKVDMKRLDETAASYKIYLSEEVQPGEHFKVIGVVNLEDIPVFPGGAPAYWKEGPLWYFRTANMRPNCLNYYRLILPKSAILVDTNREIVATDTVDGKLAVTIRNYTGPYADGLCMISFLYPDKDGTTLADIPDKYHGLQSKRDKKISDTFRQEMNKIRAGKKHTDQSTPLAAGLMCLSSIIHRDVDLYAEVTYTEQAPGYVERAAYYVDLLDSPSTPAWPENPGNGYVHPVYLCRKGSMIDEFIQPFVYQDGKWYIHETKSKTAGESEVVTPNEIAAAKAKGYLCNWEVAGPYIQKGKNHNELFSIPFGPELTGVDIPWQPIQIEPFGEHPAYVDLDEALFSFDRAVAYLRTEINSDKEKSARFEIYTDDGIKAWLNGELVHENNISRGIPDEPDIVNVTLNEGTNHLMLKVTDDVLSWGAIVRLCAVEQRLEQTTRSDVSEPGPDEPYYILVDKAAHVLGVYEKGEGDNYGRLVERFPIATGRRRRLTPTGTFFMGHKQRWKKWRPSGECTPFASNFAMDRLYIHGPMYHSQNDGGSMSPESYAQIGTDATSGCLRTTYHAAYWIYTHCPTGTVIEIKAGGTELTYPGKPARDPNYPTWDPTDPTKPEK